MVKANSDSGNVKIKVLALAFAVIFVLRGVDLTAAEISISGSEQSAELNWLKSLGLTTPKGGDVLASPFTLPLSSRSYIVPVSWFQKEAPQSVSAQDLAEDLPILSTAFQKAYGGYESAANRGWNWNKWFREWEKKASTNGVKQSLSLIEAFSPLEQLKGFQTDNHTGPLSADLMRSAVMKEGSLSAVLQKKPTGHCSQLANSSGASFPLDSNDPAQQPKLVYLQIGDNGSLSQPVYYISYPRDRGNAATIECGSEVITLTPVWSTSFLPGDSSTLAEASDVLSLVDPGAPASNLGEAMLPTYRHISDDVGYLRVPPLSDRQGSHAVADALAETAKKVTDPISKVGSEKVVILDLRINQGGFDPNLVKQFTEEVLKPWPDLQSAMRTILDANLVVKKSCVTKALQWMTNRGDVSPPLAASSLFSLQREFDHLFEPSAAGCPITFEWTSSKWNYRKHFYDAAKTQGTRRYLVVVDNLCGSDCEGTAYTLAKLPNAIIAGKNTFGVGQYIQPLVMILPHTKTPFRLASGRSDLYGDGRSFDNYGLNVDLLLMSQEQNSAENIIELANRLGGAQQ